MKLGDVAQSMVIRNGVITNRRGMIFIREGDYIITEADGQRHVCGADKFHQRFAPIE